MIVMFFFFFFQAEDGIRDVAVTGVQTCALPIFAETGVERERLKDIAVLAVWRARWNPAAAPALAEASTATFSDHRRRGLEIPQRPMQIPAVRLDGFRHVRIENDQRQTLCTRRHAADLQRRI